MTAKARVILDFRGDEADALASVNKIINQQNTLIERLKNAGSQSGRSGGAFRKAFGKTALSTVRTLATALGAGGALYTAIRLVRNEFESILETERRMSDATITWANARRSMLWMLQPQATAEKSAAEVAEEYARKIDEISASTSMRPSESMRLVQSAISAKGTLSKEDMFDAVRLGAEVSPADAAEASQITGAILGLAQSTGWKEMEANLGLLIATAGTSRPEQLGEIGRTFAPAVAAMKQVGVSPQETAALYSTLTNLAQQETGQKTRTGEINLAAAFQEYYRETYEAPEGERPELPVYEPPKKPDRVYANARAAQNAKGPWEEREAEAKKRHAEELAEAQKERAEWDAKDARAGQLVHPVVPKTLQGMMADVRSDPKRFEEFLQRAGSRAEIRMVTRRVMEREAVAEATYRDALAKQPTEAEAPERFRNIKAIIEANPQEVVADVLRTTDVAIERIETGKPEKALLGGLQERLVPLLKAAGKGALATQIAQLETWQDVKGKARELERMAESLAPEGPLDPLPGKERPPGVHVITPEERRATFRQGVPADDRKLFDILYLVADSIREAERKISEASQPPPRALPPAAEATEASQPPPRAVPPAIGGDGAALEAYTSPAGSPSVFSSPATEPTVSPATPAPAPASRAGLALATAEQAAEQIDLIRKQNTLLETLVAQPPAPLGSADRDK